VSQRRKIAAGVLIAVLILVAGGVAYAVTFGASLRTSIAGRPVGFTITGLRTRAAVAATINDESVYWSEVDQEVARAAAQYNVNLLGPDGDKQRAELTKVVLDQLIDQRLILQAARARNVDVGDAQISAEVERITREVGGEQAFQNVLAQRNLTMTDVRRILRFSLAVRALLPLVAKVDVSDAEVRRAFEERRASFDQPEQVRASHILIRANPEQEERAKQTILLIQGRLARGEKFADLARQYSEDPGSKERGGDLGFIARANLDPAFAAAAFSATPGQVTGPVKSQFGYHLILVHERRAAHTATFEEVRARLRQQLVDERQEAAFQKWLEDERKQAAIQRFPRPS